MRLSSLSLLVPVMALGLTACAGTNMPLEDRTVHFSFGKATLSAEAKGKLNTIANVAKSDESIGAVNIVGYADRIGNAKANEHLSKRRANTVKAYLNKKGWNYTNVEQTRWVGESQSTGCEDKATRKNIDCLAPDRKVEVEFISRISEFCTNWTGRHCRQN